MQHTDGIHWHLVTFFFVLKFDYFSFCGFCFHLFLLYFFHFCAPNREILSLNPPYLFTVVIFYTFAYNVFFHTVVSFLFYSDFLLHFFKRHISNFLIFYFYVTFYFSMLKSPYKNCPQNFLVLRPRGRIHTCRGFGLVRLGHAVFDTSHSETEIFSLH